MKKTKKIISCLSFIFAISCGILAKFEYEFPKDKIKKVVLENGLTIVACEYKRTPKVHLRLVYDIGSANESKGERGLAHLIEHMIFKGTEKASEVDIDGIAKKYGADLNAFTELERTSYFFETDNSNWPIFTDLLRDIAQNVSFKEQHLASEMKAVVQELNMRKDYYLLSMLERAIASIFPVGHPYHDPIIGYKEDLAALSAARLRDFYSKNYIPVKATLFMVGDIDLEDAVKKASESFCSLPSKQDDVSTNFENLETNEKMEDLKIYEDVTKEQLALFWQLPGEKVHSSILLGTISRIFGTGEGSRLQKRLVDDEKVAETVFIYPYNLKHGGVFFILIDPFDGCAEKCKEIVQDEIRKLIDFGPEASELKRVIAMSESAFVQSMENVSGFANRFISSYLETDDEYSTFKTLDKLRRIKSEDISNFFRDFLAEEKMGSIHLLPPAPETRSLIEEEKKRDKELEEEIFSIHTRTAPIEEPRLLKELPDPSLPKLEFPKATDRFLLENGLQVVLHKDMSLPLVSACFEIRDSEFIGVRNGIPLGLMLEMLNEGSENYSKKENIDFLESHGATFAGATFFSSLSSQLEPALDRALHIMLNPKFDPEALEKIKSLKLAEIKRMQDNPIQTSFHEMNNVVNNGTSRAMSYEEEEEVIKNISIEDIKNTHKNFIDPKRMVFSFSGAFNPEKLNVFLKEKLSCWESVNPKLLGKNDVGSREFEPGKTFDVSMVRDQVVLQLCQPSEVTMFDDDYNALCLLSKIAFSGMGSRLWKIRERFGLFYTSFGMMGYGAGRLPGADFIFSVINPSCTEICETLIKDVMLDIYENGVTEQELNDAKQEIFNEWIQLISSTGTVASKLGFIAIENLPDDYFDDVFKRTENITLEEINMVSKKYFDSSKLARVRVGMIPVS